MTPDTTTFEPPGPGCWELDMVHFSRPATRLFSETFPAAFSAGFRQSTKLYGALLDTLEFAPANGFMYFAPRGVGAPKGAKGPPPKPIFRLMLLLHPEIRRRLAAIRETFETRRWREDLRLWDEERKPASIKAHLALQSVDVSSLDDGELLAHLDRCLTHWAKMVEQHHRFDLAAIIPVGDFIAHAAKWTGLPAAQICMLLRGASEVSSGESPELARLRNVVRTDARARESLSSGKPAATILVSLREAGGELGEAAHGWLDLVSYRVQNGLDVSELTNIETPELLVTTIRRLLEPSATRDDLPAAIAAIAGRVPAGHRAEFDELLAEARLIYRLRDERGLYSDIWASGILRHALLAAGRKLVAAGRIARPELLLEAGWDEIGALIRGEAAAPSSETLAERASYRASVTTSDAPPALGPVSAGPPPLEWLPPVTARAELAAGIAIAGIFADSTAKHEPRVVRGLGVSSGSVEGIARVILDTSDFGRLQPGDILITRSTTAAFNVVLPLLAGIVTDRGGTLSHSAIVAREYGIPAVVGSRDATRLIADGMRILINGDLGEVQLL